MSVAPTASGTLSTMVKRDRGCQERPQTRVTWRTIGGPHRSHVRNGLSRILRMPKLHAFAAFALWSGCRARALGKSLNYPTALSSVYRRPQMALWGVLWAGFRSAGWPPLRRVRLPCAGCNPGNKLSRVDRFNIPSSHAGPEGDSTLPGKIASSP